MFALGKASLARLEGVHPDLVRVTKLAITTSSQDFGVVEGVRSQKQQRANIKKGVSWTMAGKHLIQKDGFGHAVDAVPYFNGMYRWEWALIFPMAGAFHAAAVAENVRLRWGGVWDKTFNDLPGTAEGLKAAVAEYCVRHPGIDRIDGPHFEMVT